MKPLSKYQTKRDPLTLNARVCVRELGTMNIRLTRKKRKAKRGVSRVCLRVSERLFRMHLHMVKGPRGWIAYQRFHDAAAVRPVTKKQVKQRLRQRNLVRYFSSLKNNEVSN